MLVISVYNLCFKNMVAQRFVQRAYMKDICTRTVGGGRKQDIADEVVTWPLHLLGFQYVLSVTNSIAQFRKHGR